MLPVPMHRFVTNAHHLFHQSLSLGVDLMHDIEFLKSVPLTVDLIPQKRVLITSPHLTKSGATRAEAPSAGVTLPLKKNAC